MKLKRGRKAERDDVYLKESLEQIEEWEQQLKSDDKLSLKDKTSMRNRRAALKDRVENKLKILVCDRKIERTKTRFATFMEILDDELDTKTKERVEARVNRELALID